MHSQVNTEPEGKSAQFTLTTAVTSPRVKSRGHTALSIHVSPCSTPDLFVQRWCAQLNNIKQCKETTSHFLSYQMCYATKCCTTASVAASHTEKKEWQSALGLNAQERNTQADETGHDKRRLCALMKITIKRRPASEAVSKSRHAMTKMECKQHKSRSIVLKQL